LEKVTKSLNNQITESINRYDNKLWSIFQN
jgi:hypothetical protein